MSRQFFCLPLIAIVAMCGCSNSSVPQDGSVQTQPEETSGGEPQVAMPLSPEITVMSLTELKTTLSNQSGKVCVVDLWAMW